MTIPIESIEEQIGDIRLADITTNNPNVWYEHCGVDEVRDVCPPVFAMGVFTCGR